MDCSDVHRNLIAYRENDLQPVIRKDIEAHLSGCESCRKLVTGFESVEKIIEQARVVEPNPFMTTRIIHHIENNLEKAPVKHGLIIRPILVTLVILGAIAIGYTIGKNGFDRINIVDENKSQLEQLKTELYIHDFIDESNTLLINE